MTFNMWQVNQRFCTIVTIRVMTLIIESHIISPLLVIVVIKKGYILNILKKIIAVSLIVGSFSSLSVQASLLDLGINLGSADKYTLAVGQYDYYGSPVGGSLTLGSEALIYGNVAASSRIGFGVGSTVFGDACANAIDATADVRGTASSCADISKTTGFDQLSLDIRNAYQSAATHYDALNSQNINGIFNINASNHYFSAQSLNLSSGDVLTISGNANDSIVINVSGSANIGSGAKILLDGIHARNVLFNFLDTAATSNFQFGGAEISGTFLANNRSFQLGDGATLENTRKLKTRLISM